MAFQPFENAEVNQAVADYLAVMAQNEDYKAGQLGMQAMSAFLLWATAADACESDLTRQCLVDQLAQVSEWTGGGMHAESDPGANLPTDCGIVLRLDGTSFVREHPDERGTYDCDPRYVVTVTGRVVDQANLDADRVSTPG